MITQTMPQPIHVMFGWAACHSRIFLWMAIIAMSLVSRSTILGALRYSRKRVKQTIPRPPLIEINTDISGKTNLLLY
jgi:hypothetical protein